MRNNPLGECIYTRPLERDFHLWLQSWQTAGWGKVPHFAGDFHSQLVSVCITGRDDIYFCRITNTGTLIKCRHFTTVAHMVSQTTVETLHARNHSPPRPTFCTCTTPAPTTPPSFPTGQRLRRAHQHQHPLPLLMQMIFFFCLEWSQYHWHYLQVKSMVKSKVSFFRAGD